MNATRPIASPSFSRLSFTDGQLEALKWLAFGTMLIDHFGRYAFGLSVDSWAFAVSRVTFPIFAFVLAVNMARPGDRAGRARRTGRRLTLWAILSILPSWWARGEWLPINVLMTLALGTMVFGLMERPGPVALRVVTGALLIAAGAFAEFSEPGVVLVASLARYLSRRNRMELLAACMSFGLLMGLNLAFGGIPAVLGTVAAVPLVLAASHVPISLRRNKWVFYGGYPIHFLAVAVVASVAQS